jgi:RNA polymerase sigma factor (sigma-70 family)
MTPDAELLRRYARTHSEDAFAELVRRHLNLVYSAALRQVNGDAHLAEDVAQTVFTDLARKASSLSRRATLTGWLYTSAHYAAAKIVRGENRRRDREEKFMREPIHETAPAADWERLRPALDAAMHELKEADREAILLRYFENRAFAEIGEKFGLNENAVRMRVERALEKLHHYFSKRGVSSTTAIIAGAISANSVQAAPMALAKSVTAVAIAKGAAASSSTLTLIKGALKIMAWTKAKTAIVVGATVVFTAAVVTPTVTHYYHQHTNLYARFKDKQPMLTAAQVEAYLKANGRTASSLLAAYRTSDDPALLKEAMEKYPNDPQVAFEAVFDKNLSPEQQRQWLNTFEKSAPDNALANYLSALNYFKAGQTNQAMQELAAASGKGFDDYTLDRFRDDEKAYLSAGYSAAEADRISLPWLVVPQLAPVKQLGRDLIGLANSCRQAGDGTSARAALQMAMNLGQNVANESSRMALVSQLTGISIETLALNAMNPNSPYGDNGQTVREQLNQIAQQTTALNELGQQAEPLWPMMSDQDWINYTDRRMTSGEEAALRWLVSKYGQK